MTLCVLGAGAFGSALAIALAQPDRPVVLWGRDPEAMRAMEESRQVPRLPGVVLPASVTPVATLPDRLDTALLAVPMQQLAGLCETYQAALSDAALVACCKGLSLQTGQGPTAILSKYDAHPAILTGPSFAHDIAQGLPTALTLACADGTRGQTLQDDLNAPTLRLYRSTDVTGAELGGALKNVIAIGCGAVMGAGLGASARAALMTRGFAEMVRFATTQGARPETLAGLSGLGDLTLTCTSDLSRNYRLGLSLGARSSFDPNTTVEGAATAEALAARAVREGIDMPVTQAVLALVQRRVDVADAMTALLARPAKEE